MCSANDSNLDIANNRVLTAAADMIRQYDMMPSTSEGLRQAHDAIIIMQANIHEMCVLLAQQQLGYMELSDIERRLREIQGEEKVEEDDSEEEEIVEVYIDVVQGI
jgi:hypothetical protein